MSPSEVIALKCEKERVLEARILYLLPLEIGHLFAELGSLLTMMLMPG